MIRSHLLYPAELRGRLTRDVGYTLAGSGVNFAVLPRLTELSARPVRTRWQQGAVSASRAPADRT
jgi:hypothetical protein